MSSHRDSTSEMFKKGLSDAIEDIQALAHLLDLPTKNPTPMHGRNKDYILGYFAGIKTFAPAYISKDTYLGKLLILMSDHLSEFNLSDTDQDIVESVPVVVVESPEEIDEILSEGEPEESTTQDDIDESDFIDMPKDVPHVSDEDETPVIADDDEDDDETPVIADDDEDDDETPVIADDDEDDDETPVVAEGDDDDGEDEEDIPVIIPRGPVKPKLPIDLPQTTKTARILPLTQDKTIDNKLAQNSVDWQFTELMFGILKDANSEQSRIQDFKYKSEDPLTVDSVNESLTDTIQYLKGAPVQGILDVKIIGNFSLGGLFKQVINNTPNISPEEAQRVIVEFQNRVYTALAVILQIAPCPMTKIAPPERLVELLDECEELNIPISLVRRDPKDGTTKTTKLITNNVGTKTFFGLNSKSLSGFVVQAMRDGGWLLRTNARGGQAVTVNPNILINGIVKDPILPQLYSDILNGRIPVPEQIEEALSTKSLLSGKDAKAVKGLSAFSGAGNTILDVKPEIDKLYRIGRAAHMSDKDIASLLEKYKIQLEDKAVPNVLVFVEAVVATKGEDGTSVKNKTIATPILLPIADKEKQRLLLPLFNSAIVPPQLMSSILHQVQSLVNSFIIAKMGRAVVRINPVQLIRPYIDLSYTAVKNPSEAARRSEYARKQQSADKTVGQYRRPW